RAEHLGVRVAFVLEPPLEASRQLPRHVPAPTFWSRRRRPDLPFLRARLAAVLGLPALWLALLGNGRNLLSAAELVVGAPALGAGLGGCNRFLCVHPCRPPASVSAGMPPPHFSCFSPTPIHSGPLWGPPPLSREP